MKIPIKCYEEVTNTMTVGDILKRQALGEIHREGDRIYIVTIINKEVA